MGFGTELVSALKSVLGGYSNTNNGADVAGINTLIRLGPAEVYDIAVGFTAVSTAASFTLLDATASGIGSNVKWACRAGSTSPVIDEFARPLKFDSGIVVAFTATGAANSYWWQLGWSPRRQADL